MCEVVFAIGNNIYNIGYKYTGTASQAALQIVNTFTQLAMILSVRELELLPELCLVNYWVKIN